MLIFHGSCETPAGAAGQVRPRRRETLVRSNNLLQKKGKFTLLFAEGYLPVGTEQGASAFR
jgi:hypothetical protein